VIRARALLLADGPSDVPLGAHVAALARAHGMALDVVTPEFDRMDNPPGRTVSSRLERVLRFDADFQVLLVHRDAEGMDTARRETEIADGMAQCDVAWPVVAVIPIRMTEAWLLLDEDAIRSVAGRPSGTEPLGLPSVAKVESVPDPKAKLQAALRTASGFSGRRLQKFSRDFPEHRRQLLGLLNRAGAVRQLGAWQTLELATANAVETLKSLQ
jgi:Domain of unknown function (DUF4276)